MTARQIIVRLALILFLGSAVLVMFWNYFINSAQINTLEHINKKNQSYTILEQVATINFKNKTETVNGAIVEDIREPHKFLMAHRIDYENYSSSYHSDLILSLLDQNFKPESSKTLKLEPRERTRAQDPRIFALNDQYYLLYNEASKTSKKREMYIAALDLISQPRVKKVYNLSYEQEKSADQKNWTPLTYNNKIYFIYSFNPLLILNWDQNTNKLSPLQVQDYNKKINWPYGEIRGGTPAVFVQELNAYLCFFHSSLQFKENEPPWHVRKSPFWRIYYMGAMLLDSKPPFKLLAYTDKPLTYPGLYSNKNNNMHIIFPVGVVQNAESFIISAGVQDTETVLLKADKRDIYKSLVAIN